MFGGFVAIPKVPVQDLEVPNDLGEGWAMCGVTMPAELENLLEPWCVEWGFIQRGSRVIFCEGHQ